MERYFDPTNDIAFKKIFSDKDRLKDFINTVLNLPEGHKIIFLKYISTEELPDVCKGKRSIFDLKVKDQAGNWYIVEMQKKADDNFIKRVQYYSAHSYVNQLKEGINHHQLLPVVVISIIKTKLFDDNVPCISFHKIIETSSQKEYLCDFLYVFIELGKYDSNQINSHVDEWLHMFKCAPKETDPPTNIKDKAVLSAYDTLEKYKWTDAEKDAYIRSRLAEEAIELEHQKATTKAKKEGVQEGLQKGLEEGLQKGIQQGRIEGLQEGEQKKAVETARSALRKGLDVNIIADITGLSISEIEKLKEEK